VVCLHHICIVLGMELQATLKQKYAEAYSPLLLLPRTFKVLPLHPATGSSSILNLEGGLNFKGFPTHVANRVYAHIGGKWTSETTKLLGTEFQRSSCSLLSTLET
jgi:hypothetical protein